MSEFDSSIECTECGGKNVNFLYDDYDYNGYGDVVSWDLYYCKDCDEKFHANEKSPDYGDED